MKYVKLPEEGDIILPFQGLGRKNFGRISSAKKRLEFVVVETEIFEGAVHVSARQLTDKGTYDPRGEPLDYFTTPHTRSPSIDETPVVGKMIKTYVRVP